MTRRTILVKSCRGCPYVVPDSFTPKRFCSHADYRGDYDGPKGDVQHHTHSVSVKCPLDKEK